MSLLSMFDEGLDDFKKNSPLILAGAACIGVVATSIISVCAGKKLKEKDEVVKVKLKKKEEAGEEITKGKIILANVKEKLPTLAPVIALSGVTMACMISSYKISAKRIATLTTALTVTTKAFDGYKKAAEKLLGEKEKEIQREKMKNDMKENPVPKELTTEEDNKKLTETKGGTNEEYNRVQVWYEPITNQYFKAPESEIVKAFANVRDKLRSGTYDEVTVNDWLYEIDDADHTLKAGNVFLWTYGRFPNGPTYDLSDGVKAPNGVFVGKISYEIGTGLDGQDVGWM